MRTLYDSTNINDIPSNAQMVGYYVDGIYAVAEATVRARFPNAVLVSISAIGENKGTVGDVEPGCMTPEYAVGWIKWRRAAGVDPSLYVNASAWTRQRQLIQAAGIPEPHYWVADWRNYPDPTIPTDAVARQYGGSAQTGKHYDISSVADAWPGVDMAGLTDAQAIERGYNVAINGETGNGPADEVGYLKRVVEPKLDKLLAALVSSQSADVPPILHTSPLDAALTEIRNTVATIPAALDPLATKSQIAGFVVPMLQDIQTKVAAIKPGVGGTVDLQPVLDAIAKVQAKLDQDLR
jgi:hypothetical protein